ncbi:piggyBac transposable element-derived protein 4-like [Penaeus monodon]|uniref:piggyBac transposable element-derived protein 4-like n=1 Tax=Penaeus monodon TaxID=6687 RepID=UPI0018A73BB8|nr:piggyBac transposable element-derived protein 4-like [Penaeus monodon]
MTPTDTNPPIRCLLSAPSISNPPPRKGVPWFPAVNRGEVSACHKNNMMCFKWSAKRMVHMLTSIHENNIIQTEKRDYITGEPIRKPEAVVDYTQKMRIIDKADMLLSCVESLRKSIKWYKKNFFFRIVDMARLNPYYMYLVKTGIMPSFLEFSHTMIHQMLARYREQQVPRPHSFRTGTKPLRLTERHFPSFVEATPTNPRPRRRCHVCANAQLRQRKRQMTHWQCADCGIALCLPECFRVYHTRVKY